MEKIVLERALDLLSKIRFCTWPTAGLGIGLTASEFDELLLDAEALKKAERRKINQGERDKAHLAILKDAASRVRTAFLAYGPVDDGRPEGDEFDAALDALRDAAVAAGAIKGKNR